jgi:hypothetical protein
LVILAGCSTVHDRHDKFYESIRWVAEEQRASDEAQLRIKAELVKALFHRDYSLPGYSAVSDKPVDRSFDLVKIMAMMMIFNDHKDPRRLQYALERIPAPAPTIGERVSDGVFRVLPSVVGIAAGAFAIDSIRRAAEGASAFAAGAGSTSVSNTTNSTNNYKYQSENTQTASVDQGNTSGGGAPGAGSGGRVSGSGNQGNAAGIGQGQNFNGGPVAFGSDGFMPSQLPAPAPPSGPSILPVSQ